MAKDVTIRIKAVNAFRRGINAATRGLRTLGRVARTVGRSIRLAFLGVTAATGGLVVAAGAMIKAYSVQQQAEIKLAAALRAHGDEVNKLLPQYKAFAAAIQDETAVADEATLANMALLRTLGVEADQLERATKAMIALGVAGANGETAARGVASALAGNYSLLTRYVPALRDAATAEEKLAVFNDLARRGYRQAREELRTLSGRYKEIKGRMGDFAEEVGRQIVGGTGLEDVLANASERIKDFTDKLKKSGFVEGLFKGGEKRAQILQGLKEWVRGIADGAKEWLLKYAPEIGEVIGQAMWKSFSRMGRGVGGRLTKSTLTRGAEESVAAYQERTGRFAPWAPSTQIKRGAQAYDRRQDFPGGSVVGPYGTIRGVPVVKLDKETLKKLGEELRAGER